MLKPLRLTISYDISNNRPLASVVTAHTVGTNLFGESYTTDSPTQSFYHAKASAPHNIFGEISGAVTDSTTIGSDIWGATYTTTSHTAYDISNNRPLASVVTAHTVGTNLFGESYTTDSTTQYFYHAKASAPHNIFGEISGAVTDSTTIGSDIWGATYTTTSHTAYDISNNRPLASVVTEAKGLLFEMSYAVWDVVVYVAPQISEPIVVESVTAPLISPKIL